MSLLLSNVKIERRDHPSNPSDALLYALGGGVRTFTGLNVNEDNALYSIPVLAAVRKIAETIASLPLHLYKRLKPQGKERATEHPLYRILHLQPNPEMTSMLYRETATGQLLTWGNHYSEIERNRNGTIQALWPLLPGKMEVKRAGVELPNIKKGELYYVYRLPNGQPKILLREKVLHIRGFSKDGIMGYSMIEKGREGIALGLALEEYGARFFGNNAKPHVVLEHPGELSIDAKQRLRKAWEGAHQGLSQAHRMGILEEGMKLKEYGITPEDAQALESREFQVEEVARLLNVPPHKIQDLRRSTFSNIEEQNIEYVVDTIRPWHVRIEQAYSTQLLRISEQSQYFFEHLIDGLLRGNAQSRWEAYTKGFMIGAYSIDDIMELENRNPVEGGDVRMVPLNMQPLSWVAGESQPPTPIQALPARKELKSIELRARRPEHRDRIKKAYHRLFADAVARVVNKESVALKHATKKHFGQRNIQSLNEQRNIQSFNEWIDEFYKELPKDVKRNFLPVLTSYAEEIQAAAAGEIGGVVGMTAALNTFIEDYMDGYSQRYINSSMGQLQQLIRETEVESLEETLNTRADEWTETRPQKIASNETVRASEAIVSQVFLMAGFLLIWRTSGNPCPYCASLDGKVVGRGQSFVAGNTDLQPEGTQQPMMVKTPRFHPPLHQGCVCWIGPG